MIKACNWRSMGPNHIVVMKHLCDNLGYTGGHNFVFASTHFIPDLVLLIYNINIVWSRGNLFYPGLKPTILVRDDIARSYEYTTLIFQFPKYVSEYESFCVPVGYGYLSAMYIPPLMTNGPCGTSWLAGHSRTLLRMTYIIWNHNTQFLTHKNENDYINNSYRR